MKGKKGKFQRTKFRAYAKLGAAQKSKQKYRKAKGRHNKTRQKWKGRPKRVEIGYKRKKITRGLINNKNPILIRNIQDLKKVGLNNVIIIGKIGRKKRIGLIEEAKKRKIEIVHFNVNRFSKKIEWLNLQKKKDRGEKIENKEEKKDNTKNIKEIKK